ncbi:hypothetical protein D9M69_622120 [compost metagenome]
MHPAVNQVALVERPYTKAFVWKQRRDALKFSLEQGVVNADILNQRLDTRKEMLQPTIALNPFGVERHQSFDFRGNFGAALNNAAVEGMQNDPLFNAACPDDFDGLLDQPFIRCAIRA